jgi:RimJ/RimL family protein N-acetyltransferase
MLEHALRFLPRVVFVVGENNIRSQRALEKIGARFEKRVPRPDAEGVWDLVYVITR